MDKFEGTLEYGADEPTVCPAHLRFVPCRRCKPGEEKYSTDRRDVERTREYQQYGRLPS